MLAGLERQARDQPAHAVGDDGDRLDAGLCNRVQTVGELIGQTFQIQTPVVSEDIQAVATS